MPQANLWMQSKMMGSPDYRAICLMVEFSRFSDKNKDFSNEQFSNYSLNK